MIKVSNVFKNYSKKIVLKNINLEIKKGEKIAIMGLNGSGKTTLAEIILKIFSPSSGEVVYEDKNISKNATFQDINFDGELNLKQLVNFYCGAFKVKVNTSEYFKKFDLENETKQKYLKLSGGQKQKFKFLITLLNNPKLLLLDELTTSLDYLWRHKIVLLIKDYIIKNDCTLIMVSHDIEEVSQLCDRVLLMSNGEIIKDLDLKKTKEESINILKKEILSNASNI
ncbi:ABC transporter ATP-binding protein [Spiroplasma litorale]|uniref:ABC transporter ATP-binding protein n=1 Tax=Spiroplasma litorale TaxID=216942 RepID=A0A0K1W1W6_9MOLU|nr:ABC transporter ATP-binding protein [Spiroplasma litorale]AKX34097.1 ABC transporter ATP-binding protein [Spiroplasma litorale]